MGGALGANEETQQKRDGKKGEKDTDRQQRTEAEKACLWFKLRTRRESKKIKKSSQKDV